MLSVIKLSVKGLSPEQLLVQELGTMAGGERGKLDKTLDRVAETCEEFVWEAVTSVTDDTKGGERETAIV